MTFSQPLWASWVRKNWAFLLWRLRYGHFPEKLFSDINFASSTLRRLLTWKWATKPSYNYQQMKKWPRFQYFQCPIGQWDTTIFGVNFAFTQIWTIPRPIQAYYWNQVFYYIGSLAINFCPTPLAALFCNQKQNISQWTKYSRNFVWKQYICPAWVMCVLTHLKYVCWVLTPLDTHGNPLRLRVVKS